MTEPAPQAPPPAPPPVVLFPRWLGLAIVVLLSAQVTLAWLQGALLHRQQEELRAIRSEMQELYDALEPAQGGAEGREGLRRMAGPAPSPVLRPVARLVLDGDEEDRARRELQESRDSARKAVTDARKAQEQVSITEHARKVEERKQIEGAQSRWQVWTLGALALAVLAFLVRGWLRSRG